MGCHVDKILASVESLSLNEHHYCQIIEASQTSDGWYNIGYLSETHLNLKFCNMSFIQNTHFRSQIILTFCTEHGRDTAMLCAKFQNDLMIERNFMGKLLAKFEFKLHFGLICYAEQPPVKMANTNGHHPCFGSSHLSPPMLTSQYHYP